MNSYNNFNKRIKRIVLIIQLILWKTFINNLHILEYFKKKELVKETVYVYSV